MCIRDRSLGGPLPAVGPVKRKGRVRRVGWDEVARPPVTVRQVHIRPVGRCTCAQAPFLAAYSSTDALRISEVSAARRAAVSVLKYAGAPMRPGLERFAVLRVDVRPEVLPPGWHPGWIATQWASGRDRGVSSLCSGKSRLTPRSSSA